MTEISCPHCGNESVVVEPEDAWSRCQECQAMVFRTGGGHRVVFAHASSDICAQAGRVLVEGGMHPIRAVTGKEAMELLDKHSGQALVLDVGLVDPTSYEVVSMIRGNGGTEQLPIVLLASVYNRTAYKRRPTSLYGANDYVEQHHIPDMLVPKLRALLGEPKDYDGQADDATLKQLKKGEERRDLSDEVRVQALAHSIVADIALYHQKEMMQVLDGASLDHLEEALEEGRRVLEEKLGAYPEGDDPLVRALDRFIRSINEVTK